MDKQEPTHDDPTIVGSQHEEKLTNTSNGVTSQDRQTSPPKRIVLRRSQANSNAALTALTGASDWKTWPELTVHLSNLHRSMTTWQLFSAFTPYGGRIVFIEIQEGKTRDRLPTARLRFSPVPDRAFWLTGQCKIAANGRQIAHVSLEGPPREMYDRVRSPVHSRIFYPSKIQLQPEEMQFCSITGPDHIMVHRSVLPVGNLEAAENMRMDVRLKKRDFSLYFYVKAAASKSGMLAYKMVFEFGHLKRLIRQKLDDGRWALILPLLYPACYYGQRKDIKETFTDDRPVWSTSQLWYRITDITVGNPRLLFGQPISLIQEDRNDDSFINIGRWTTLRLLFPKNTGGEVLLRALRDFNLTTVVKNEIFIEPSRPTVFTQMVHPASNNDALTLLDSSSSTLASLSFPLRYQLEVCLSRGILDEYSITPAFVTALNKMKSPQGQLMLEYFADAGQRIFDAMSIFQNADARAYYPMGHIPDYCAVIRKVLVTPTTMHLSSPTVETTNRVLRKYSYVQDRFLRVQFTDELLKGRIHSSPGDDREDYLYTRVYRVLTRGIRIGDRLYQFLAFGNSQIRDCGAYFFCPTEHVDCNEIRAWMGNFNHIKVVAKYASRLGQCFSTTRAIRGVSVPVIRPIPDIERNGFCFTDGVGKISKFLAEMIVREMGLSTAVLPSAYQFRMGGCKGVLTVWPEARNMEVHIRRSQEKFKADFNGLEIIRCSQFAAATLNRQTITILEGLGVPESAFVRLLTEQLDQYEKAMTDVRTAVAILGRYVDENQTTIALAEMLLAGFSGNQEEPFVTSLLHLWRIWSLKLLKDKARIVVEKGAFLLGCVDEGGYLRGHSEEWEGLATRDVSKLSQIFLQIPNPENPREYTVITGVCVVGRNPSLHPGDLRVVEAVDIPELHHLRDVVVFPSTGNRDVPSMLSGGDLDGDDFFVFWDPDLLPAEWNHAPMKNMETKPKETRDVVRVDDLRRFFVRYMKNDILPKIAHAHLALADFYDEGPKHPKCLELAQLHSKAVDYVKSGDAAEMPRRLQPTQWPHYMEKHGRSYTSTRTLGKLYDQTKKVQFHPLYTKSFNRTVLSVSTSPEMLKEVRKIKTQYDTSMRRLMGQHEINTEFEIWSGFVLSRPRVGSAYKIQETIGRESSILKQRFREICHKAAGGMEPDRMRPWVAAMYRVTQEEVLIALHERTNMLNADGGSSSTPPTKMLNPRSMPLISFPWIFHTYLCDIVRRGRDKSLEIVPVLDLNITKLSRPGMKGGDVAEKDVPTGSTSIPESSASISTPAPVPMHGQISTRLNDGRVIHRGEVLNLFEDEDDNLSQGPADNGASDQEEDSYFLEDDFLGPSFPGILPEAESQVAAFVDTEASSEIPETEDLENPTDGDDQEAEEVVYREEEAAVDRLLAMMGDEDEDGHEE